MKYNSSNKPLVCMQTTSKCYKGTRTMTPKGILWHSTGANNPALSRYVQPSDNAKDRAEMLKILGKNKYGTDWNHEQVSAGLNCWIGKLADGTVTTVQTMPWNYRPWGCGSGKNGSCNDNWIQFEICEDSMNDKAYFEAAYKEACEITAYLCDMYGLDPMGTTTYNGVKVPVILCHYDSYKLGLGTSHSDIYHWFDRYGKDMDDVRRDVKAIMTGKSSSTITQQPSELKLYRIRKSWEDSKSQIGAYTNFDNAKKDWKDGYFIYDWNGKQVYPATNNVTPVKELCSLADVDADLPVIMKGCSGLGVRILQTILGVEADGIAGNATDEAIRDYQKSHGLEADGIVGKTTWASLIYRVKTNTYK